MSSDDANLKPMKLYSHKTGANAWKVAMTLNVLNIPYTTEYMEMNDFKKEEYLNICVNGRVPTLIDSNTGITIWESGAILQYLAHKYDPSNTISYEIGTEAYFQTIQWIAFQISGQGPYYGQAAWFNFFHPEKLPSAISRYSKEIIRVVGVIDRHLTTTNQKYLVADAEHPEGKLTVADIIFVPWAVVGERLLAEGDGLYAEGKNQAYKRWLERVMEVEGVRRALEVKAGLAG